MKLDRVLESSILPLLALRELVPRPLHGADDGVPLLLVLPRLAVHGDLRRRHGEQEALGRGLDRALLADDGPAEGVVALDRRRRACGDLEDDRAAGGERAGERDLVGVVAGGGLPLPGFVAF